MWIPVPGAFESCPMKLGCRFSTWLMTTCIWCFPCKLVNILMNYFLLWEWRYVPLLKMHATKLKSTSDFCLVIARNFWISHDLVVLQSKQLHLSPFQKNKKALKYTTLSDNVVLAISSTLGHPFCIVLNFLGCPWCLLIEPKICQLLNFIHIFKSRRTRTKTDSKKTFFPWLVAIGNLQNQTENIHEKHCDFQFTEEITQPCCSQPT